MAELLDYLNRAVDDKASDVFIVAGGPVCEKLDKRIHPIGEDRVLPQDTERIITELYEQAQRPMEQRLRAATTIFRFRWQDWRAFV